MKKIFLGLLLIPGIAFGMYEEKSIAILSQELKAENRKTHLLDTVAKGVTFVPAMAVGYHAMSSTMDKVHKPIAHFSSRLQPIDRAIVSIITLPLLFIMTPAAASLGIVTGGVTWVCGEAIREAAVKNSLARARKIEADLSRAIAYNDDHSTDTGMTYWLK